LAAPPTSALQLPELLPPYDLRHSFASLQIRAGLSLPELAEQLGHAPQMTLATYAPVMRSSEAFPRSPPRLRSRPLANRVAHR